MSLQKPFKKIKVVELAGVLAGPSAGAFLAELGAEVIKIENKTTNGDVTRSWKLPSENSNASDSAYFWSVNKGKKSIFLNLSQKSDYEKCLSKITNADILISNFKKGDDKKFGLDYTTVKQKNPKLIYASVNGFGEENQRAAYDLVLQAESGFMNMNGAADGPPCKLPVALIDVIAGHQLKEAILIALLHRSKTGKGCKLSVSLFDAAISALVNQGSNWLIAKIDAKRSGSLHPNIAPYGELFTTKDNKSITFAIGNDKQFKQLCSILNIESITKIDLFSSNQQRVKNRKKLKSVLQKEIKKFSLQKLYTSSLKKDVPIARIRKISEALASKESKRMIVKGKKTTLRHFAGKFKS